MNTNKTKEVLEEMVDATREAISTKYRKVKNYFSDMMRRASEFESNSPSKRRGQKMTVIEKGPTKVITSSEYRLGSSKTEKRRESTRPADVKEKSGRKESDLISTATSALRRLHFRSAGGGHPKRVDVATLTEQSEKGQQKNSSMTSENNKSTDSSNTVSTTVTVTDAEQEDKGDHDLLESKPLLKESFEEIEEISPNDNLIDFDELFLQNEMRVNAEMANGKFMQNGVKSHQGMGGGTEKASGAPRIATFQKDKFFSKPFMIDEEINQNFEAIIENESSEEEKHVNIERPRSNIKVIQSELPQRTFSTNFNKRKKVGDQEERRQSQAELGRATPYTYSPNLKPMDDTLFSFPPQSYSPIPMSKSTSPRLQRETPTGLKKFTDASTSPIHNFRSATPRKAPSHTVTLSDLQDQEMDVQGYRSNFCSGLNLTSPTEMMNSPSFEINFNENDLSFEISSFASSTGSSMPHVGEESEDQNGGKDDENTTSEDETRMSHKRKKRHDLKIFSMDTSDEDSNFVQSRNSRDAFLNSFSENTINLPQNRKYSVLATDGSVKNFVSENSKEFKKSGQNVDKENINMNKAARRSSETPQRHRRVSLLQGENLRHYLFEEPDTSRMKPSKQRKVSMVIEETTRNLLLEDVHSRKSSLAPGDPTKMGDESPGKSSTAQDDKPRKFSINTLGDIVSARKFSLLPPGEIYTSQVDGKTTEVIKLAPVAKGKPLATIVVQQASIQRGSISGPSGQREDSFLNVANQFTLEELHEFDMKYGSPHHCRSQSVKIPGRPNGRPNYLSLPQQRSRVASMPNTGVEEEYYRLRHFSIGGKGEVLNRGDSLKSRRSRSINSVASSNSSHSTDHMGSNAAGVGSCPGSAECSLASSRDSSTTALPYKVIIFGSAGVGKTSLISQLMTSEYINTYARDSSSDDDYGEKTVSVLLDDEETELRFIDFTTLNMSIEECINTEQPHAYVVVYSIVDRASFEIADQILQTIWRCETTVSKAVILVANKTDLVRSRIVTHNEGKGKARSFGCKFIEVSVGINHNVDELLVGIVSQIRLKLKRAAKGEETLTETEKTQLEGYEEWFKKQ